MIVKLSKPMEVSAGKTVTELELNLDALTGRDLARVERDMRKVGESVGDSFNYSLRIAACASDTPYEAILSLPAKNCYALVSAVNDFFASSDSEIETPTEVSTTSIKKSGAQ